MLKIGDLFAGIGGVATGFVNAGFDVSYANEINEQSCKTYRANFSHKLYCCSIEELDPTLLEPIDVLCGGFPCQPFSIAGDRKGFQDHRGNMFFEILRIAEIQQPQCIFLENVKNLLGHDAGKTLDTVLKSLEMLGYHTKYKVMNTCEYSDIPQNRERIYIVAFKSITAFNNFTFPKKCDKTTKPIQTMLDKTVHNKYYYTNSKYYPMLSKTITLKDTCYQLRRIYVRENKNGLCPTLTANMGTGGHNVPLVLTDAGIRKLTPRECARFQGFPDEFVLPSIADSHLYKQIGNSVSVPVIELIAKNIYSVLKDK